MLMNASRARKDISRATRLWVCSPSRFGGDVRAHRAAASACSRARANIVCSRWVRSHACSPAPVSGGMSRPGGGAAARPPCGAGVEGATSGRCRRRRRLGRVMTLQFGGAGPTSRPTTPELTGGDREPARRRETTMAELTPMMRQYRALKDQHPNAVLLFRLGDFFEAFFDDAIVV